VDVCTAFSSAATTTPAEVVKWNESLNAISVIWTKNKIFFDKTKADGDKCAKGAESSLVLSLWTVSATTTTTTTKDLIIFFFIDFGGLQLQLTAGREWRAHRTPTPLFPPKARSVRSIDGGDCVCVCGPLTAALVRVYARVRKW